MVRLLEPSKRSGRSNWTGSPRRSSDILDGLLHDPEHLNRRSGLIVLIIYFKLNLKMFTRIIGLETLKSLEITKTLILSFTFFMLVLLQYLD